MKDIVNNPLCCHANPCQKTSLFISHLRSFYDCLLWALSLFSSLRLLFRLLISSLLWKIICLSSIPSIRADPPFLLYFPLDFIYPVLLCNLSPWEFWGFLFFCTPTRSMRRIFLFWCCMICTVLWLLPHIPKTCLLSSLKTKFPLGVNSSYYPLCWNQSAKQSTINMKYWCTYEKEAPPPNIN